MLQRVLKRYLLSFFVSTVTGAIASLVMFWVVLPALYGFELPIYVQLNIIVACGTVGFIVSWMREPDGEYRWDDMTVLKVSAGAGAAACVIINVIVLLGTGLISLFL